ncbi:hypothetical protein C5O27_02705 [Gordonia alkanivorans]|uniref:hypothetical protein n=1 Tax=Gordonia alkanivorans TaxID=84096 RepID=UPI000FDEA440|nr:hypothetical protein [Gordonia alkanivorans]AZZ80137.1 hypothetical protein C5O27_02705 [Gordonia alkanivorans]
MARKSEEDSMSGGSSGGVYGRRVDVANGADAEWRREDTMRLYLDGAAVAVECGPVPEHFDIEAIAESAANNLAGLYDEVQLISGERGVIGDQPAEVLELDALSDGTVYRFKVLASAGGGRAIVASAKCEVAALDVLGPKIDNLLGSLVIDPQFRAVDQQWRAGDIVTYPSDEQWAVAKVLVIESGIVHLRLYSNRFDGAPSELNPATLQLGSVTGGDGPIGIGHLPLARTEFLSWNPILVQHSSVSDEECEGYRLWADANGGVFT